MRAQHRRQQHCGRRGAERTVYNPPRREVLPKSQLSNQRPHAQLLECAFARVVARTVPTL
eukprot:359446-Chlamydomonas_euryale.AAC.1